MKRIITLLSIIFLTFNVFAQSESKDPINWLTLDEAIELQKETPKKIFIDVYTDWCGWCKKMDRSTFMDEDVAKSINENYYAVKFNAEVKEPITFKGKTFVNPNPTGRRSAHQLAAYLLSNKLSYPSFALLDEDLNLLTTLKGFLKPNQIIPVVDYLGNDLHNTDTKWEDYLKEYQESHP